MKASKNIKTQNYTDRCPLLYVMELIGSKWKLPILWCLNDEDGLHYNELKRRVHGVTNTMLTKCLRELEERGLVSRHSRGSVPPSVTYHLREDGRSLMPALEGLCRWGMDYLKKHEEGGGTCEDKG
ncbi:winged helix-turn-helix transcriptional regulator [Fretibacterium sp. OH1220_COT-178]|uniref:winged helix-turn-helix transcriptional regulator n=1 Tax=Fretibacterium sp. OH1220_COT-178 TaxID=2491047 RepID=UPI000F5D8BE9|nr:helix-turn-helix domain-containing protein [Fretibacterium sp. OH1220_COT-178]RRD63940.1 transcriptional regulator [Fretibacterium sp. OH1220_COT-178]